MGATIDLRKYRHNGSRIFYGEKVGELAKKELQLRKLERQEEKITVVIPSDTWDINGSFFSGMFEESVKRLGINLFRNKYEFVFDNGELLPVEMKKSIEECIYTAAYWE